MIIITSLIKKLFLHYSQQLQKVQKVIEESIYLKRKESNLSGKKEGIYLERKKVFIWKEICIQNSQNDGNSKGNNEYEGNNELEGIMV